MKCLFCDAEESVFVELLSWNAARERARELLLQGVCTMHASDMPPHPRDPSVFELHPALNERRTKLAVLHHSQFGGPGWEHAEDGHLRFGQRYFRLDSPEGAMVRAARGGHVDATVAHVGGPVDAIEIERVPDVAALAEVVRDTGRRQ